MDQSQPDEDIVIPVTNKQQNIETEISIPPEVVNEFDDNHHTEQVEHIMLVNSIKNKDNDTIPSPRKAHAITEPRLQKDEPILPLSHIQTTEEKDDIEDGLKTGRGMETGRALMTTLSGNEDVSPPRRAIRKRKVTAPLVNVVEQLNINLTIPPVSQTSGSQDIYLVKGPMGKGL